MELNEIWKDIFGYEGLYQVSNLSKVRSLDKVIFKSNGSKQFMPSKVMKANLDSKGYLKYNFYKDGVIKTVRQHQLVATAFIPNPNNYPIVRHLDDNKLNNLLGNLAWGTDLDNKKDMIRNGNSLTGSKNPRWGMSGEKSNDSKLILDTQTGIYYHGTAEAAKAKGLIQSTLKSRLNGRLKTNNTSLIYC